MRVFHVSHESVGGGAKAAAQRIIESTRGYSLSAEFFPPEHAVGVDSASKIKRMLKSKNPDFLRLLSIFGGSIKGKPLSYNFFSAGKDCINRLNSADLVHLHWIARGPIGINDLKLIKIPIVWTLHDFWPLQGIFHFPEIGSEDEVGASYVNPAYRILENYAKKKKAELHAKLHFVSPSRWLHDAAVQKGLVRKNSIQIIPNPIDTNFWSPAASSRAHSAQKTDFYTVMFSAADVTSHNKGLTDIVSAVQNIAASGSIPIQLLVVGSGIVEIHDSSCMQYLAVGPVHDPHLLREFYRSADVVVLPSQVDNLPYTGLEAIACGKPVVGYENGGIPEICLHRINGFTVENKNIRDFCGALLALRDPQKNNGFGKRSRILAEKKFSSKIIGKKYRNLYDALRNSDRL